MNERNREPKVRKRAQDPTQKTRKRKRKIEIHPEVHPVARRAEVESIPLLSDLCGTRNLHIDLIGGTEKDRSHLRASSTKTVSDQVCLGLIELAERVVYPRLVEGKQDDAAGDLAFLAITAAELLESLATEHHMSIRCAALGQTKWPVTLGLSSRHQKGEITPTLLGGARAKSYLVDLDLGADTGLSIRHLWKPAANLFNRAAERVMITLTQGRDAAVMKGATGRSLSMWEARLAELPSPVTVDNIDQWWDAAKLLLDKLWMERQYLFTPLIRASKSKDQDLDKAPLYHSELRSRVIDLRLQGSFNELIKEPDA